MSTVEICVSMQAYCPFYGILLLCFAFSTIKAIRSTELGENTVIQLLEDLAHKIHNRLGLRMHRLAVASWEIRLKVDLLGKIDGSWRVVVTNPTGHTCIVQVMYLSFLDVYGLGLTF